MFSKVAFSMSLSERSSFEFSVGMIDVDFPSFNNCLDVFQNNFISVVSVESKESKFSK